MNCKDTCFHWSQNNTRHWAFRSPLIKGLSSSLSSPLLSSLHPLIRLHPLARQLASLQCVVELLCGLHLLQATCHFQPQQHPAPPLVSPHPHPPPPPPLELRCPVTSSAAGQFLLAAVAPCLSWFACDCAKCFEMLLDVIYNAVILN